MKTKIRSKRKITDENISDHQFGSITFIKSKCDVSASWAPGAFVNAEHIAENVADKNLSCITYILVRTIDI